MGAWAAFDFTGDGADEVVAVDGEGRILALNGDGTPAFINLRPSYFRTLDGDSSIVYPPIFALAAWPDARLVSSPAIGDVDGDGLADVVAASDDGRVFAYRFADADADSFADAVLGFPVDLGGGCSGVALDDIDQDAALEVIVPVDDHLLALDGNGSVVWTTGLGDGASCAPAVLPGERVVVGTAGGEVATVSSSGDVVASRDLGARVDGVAIADLDRDGTYDVVASGVGALCAWPIDGASALFGWPAASPPNRPRPPSVWDVDRDGRAEVVVGDDGSVYVYGYNGALRSDFPREIDRGDTLDACVGQCVASADGDVLSSTREGLVRGYDRASRSLAGFPLAVGSSSSSSPSFGDLDGDGDVELIASSDDGAIVAWDLATPVSSQWPLERREPSRTAFLPASVLGPVVAAGALVPEGTFFAYPNPAKERATIRYRLSRSADVSITLYDLSGAEVDRVDGGGLPGADNEVSWDATRVAPGVYICRLQAEGSGERSVLFTKIAVVR